MWLRERQCDGSGHYQDAAAQCSDCEGVVKDHVR